MKRYEGLIIVGILGILAAIIVPVVIRVQENETALPQPAEAIVYEGEIPHSETRKVEQILAGKVNVLLVCDDDNAIYVAWRIGTGVDIEVLNNDGACRE